MAPGVPEFYRRAADDAETRREQARVLMADAARVVEELDALLADLGIQG